MYQLGWFSTGRDRAARDLLTVVVQSIARGEIKAGIAFVFCNRERGENAESDRFLRLVEDYGLPLVSYSYQRFKSAVDTVATPGEGLPRWRLDYDREVMKRLEGFHPDLCVLAGYMLVVGAEMCRRYTMINLHPAAPGGPKGTWQQVIWQLIEGRAEETGVMMHLVTPELDRGPVVAYCTFAIVGKPFDEYWHIIKATPPNSRKGYRARGTLFKLIREHGLVREFPLITRTIKAFSEGKIKITPDKKVVDADNNPTMGYDMTDEINRLIERAS